MPKKSTILQELLNAFPEWSDMRQDEQSLGGQLFNVVGNRLQDLREQIDTLSKNNNLPTANLNDIDNIYKFNLPKGFEFEVTDDDEINSTIIPPTVSGLVDDTWYPLVLASGNNIETFWYTSHPNRITCSGYLLTNTIPDDNNRDLLGGLVQGYEQDSPIIPVSSGIYLDNPTRLWVEVMSGVTFLGIDDNKNVTRGLVTLGGISRKGIFEEESLVFLHNDIQLTNKEWLKLEQVQAQNIDNPDTTKVRITAHRFGREHSPQLPPLLDNFNLATSSVTKDPIDTFWDVDTEEPKLNFITWIADDIRDRIGGLLDKQIIRSWTLIKKAGSTTIGTPIDLALQPFTHNIWVIDDNNYLYLYDDNLTLPSMRQLTQKKFDAMSVIEPSTYHMVINETVTINYFWKRPVKDIARHRVYVTAPNGAQYSVIAGALTSLDLNGSWVFGSPTSTSLRHSDVFTLDQYGDWLWTMDVVYSDTTTETDQRIISVDYKIANAEFDLSNCLDLNYNVKGIDFDSDQTMWIAAYNSITDAYKKYKVTLHKDVMMIDTDQKIIFLKEEYSQLKVVL